MTWYNICTYLEEDFRMAKQHDKQFKLDAIQYYEDHKDLGLRGCANNLGIGYSTLTKWRKELRDSGDIVVRDSGNYESDEQKEIARLRRELRDTEQFNPERPNAVWCSDITYVWTIDGFVYLTSIMDLYSRKIIAWTLSDSLEVSCVTETIQKAKLRRNLDLPLIIHSDRGSQYVAKEYKKATARMQRSYSKFPAFQEKHPLQ